jgi:hypothetical protein
MKPLTGYEPGDMAFRASQARGAKERERMKAALYREMKDATWIGKYIKPIHSSPSTWVGM